MKRITQPIQDIITAQTMAGRSGSQALKTTNNLDLKGVQDALASFDSYLKGHLKESLKEHVNGHVKNDPKAAIQGSDLLKNSPSDSLFSLSVSAVSDSGTGKNSPLGGKNRPLPQSVSVQESSQSAGYITAAQNLIDGLSSKSEGVVTQTDDANPDGSYFDGSSLDSPYPDRSYELFGSPIYQSLIGNRAGGTDGKNIEEHINLLTSTELSDQQQSAGTRQSITGQATISPLQPLSIPQEAVADLPNTDLPQALTKILTKTNTDLPFEGGSGGQIRATDLNQVIRSQNSLQSALLEQSVGSSKPDISSGISPHIKSALPGSSLVDISARQAVATETKLATEITGTSDMAKGRLMAEHMAEHMDAQPPKMPYQNSGSGLALVSSPSSVSPSVPSQVNNPGQSVMEQIAETAAHGMSASTDDHPGSGLERANLNEPLLAAHAKTMDAGISSINTTYSLGQEIDQTSRHLEHQGLRLKIDTPVMQDGWNREFALKVRTLAAAGEQTASLQLNPSELGSIEITMTTESDRAKVHFVVQSAVAREALENSLSKLREFFEESGMTLADAGVEDQSAGSDPGDQLADQSSQQKAASGTDDPLGSEAGEGAPDISAKTQNGQLNSTIDYYI